MAFYCWCSVVFVFLIFNHMYQNSSPKYVTIYLLHPLHVCVYRYTCTCTRDFVYIYIYIFLGLLIYNLLSSFCILCPFVPFGIIRYRVMSFNLWTPELFLYNYFDIKNRLFEDYCCINCKTMLQTLAASTIII